MKPTALYSSAAAKGWLPWGPLAPFLCIALVAIPDATAELSLRALHFADKKGDPVGLLGWCLFLLVTFTLMGLVFLAWVRLVERRPLATIGLVGPHRVRTYLGGLAIGAASSATVVAAIWIAGGYRAGGYGAAFASPRALLSIAALLPCFAVQSAVEEMIFRGWLLSGIARKLNVPLAVVLSSATFTLLHYERHQHWAATTAIFLFAVFACAWSRRAGSVWGVMGWHATWNWLLGVGFELPITGLRANLPALLVKLTPVGGVLLTGGAQGPEGSLWCSAFFVAAIAYLAARSRAARPLVVERDTSPDPAY